MWQEQLFLLLGAHAVTDYALQSETMATRKRPSIFKAANQRTYGPWWWWMSAHSLINGLGVALILSWEFGVLETITHWCLDVSKCQGKLTTKQDQALHLLSKVLWVCLAQ